MREHLRRGLPDLEGEVRFLSSEWYPILELELLMDVIDAAGNFLSNFLHLFIALVLPSAGVRKVDVVHIAAGAVGKNADKRRRSSLELPTGGFIRT